MAANALLSGLIEEVILLTKRPDLAAATKQAVLAATQKAHSSDYYYKDLFETGIQFESSLYLQQLAVKTLVPRYRSLKYMRKISLDTNSVLGYTERNFLEVIVPELSKDSYGVTREDVVYGSGALLQIRSRTQESLYLLGCYLYPQLTEETYTSWIAEEFKYSIIFDAAATVFKGIGFDEMAAQFRNDSAMWLTELKNSNIVVTGT